MAARYIERCHRNSTGMDGDPNDTLCIEEQDFALGLEIDARTAVTAWLGEQMDYGFAVATLMDIAQANVLTERAESS